MRKKSIASMNNQDNFIDNHWDAYTNNGVFFTFFSQKSFFCSETVRIEKEIVIVQILCSSLIFCRSSV